MSPARLWRPWEPASKTCRASPAPPRRRCWKPFTGITPKSDDASQAPQRRCYGAPGRRRAVALAILCTLLFLTFLDNTIVSVGLGSVQADLHAGVLALQWIVGAYALTFASAMLAFGMVGDEFGRKKSHARRRRGILRRIGPVCAGAQFGVLIPGPCRHGAGRGRAASRAPCPCSGTSTATSETRNRAIGVWAAVSGLALTAGPVLGGALVGIWNWRAIFWFNLLFGAVTLVAAAIVLPENADPEAHRVDIAGALLGAAALAALIFGVMTGESTGFTAPAVLALFCVSAVAGCAFLWREYRAAHPLLDLRFLRVARFTHAECGRVLFLLRDVRDLLLHRPVPRRGRRLLRIPDRARVLADGGADDHVVGAGGYLAEPGRDCAGRSAAAACVSRPGCC